MPLLALALARQVLVGYSGVGCGLHGAGIAAQHRIVPTPHALAGRTNCHRPPYLEHYAASGMSQHATLRGLVRM